MASPLPKNSLIQPPPMMATCRPANVQVPEADYEHARQLFFTEREDEL